MKPNSTNNYNTISVTECQEEFNTPTFFKKLQESHKKNKKALHEMALQKEEIEKANRIISCTNFLTYELINEEFLRLHRINLCRERLCLNCQLVNSRNLIKQLFWSVPRLKVPQNHTLQFVTLTVPNTQGNTLKNVIQNMVKRQMAFFRHYKIKDFFRSIEVTYNKNKDTYHPHLHILAIIPLDSGFPFYKNNEKEKGVNELQKAWYEWYGVPNEYGYNLATTYEIKNTKSIFEVCKYVSKVEDLENVEILKVLNDQLKSLRLKTPCGQFKTLAKAYKQECMSLKLQEMRELEKAERQLVHMLYNHTTKDYEIKSITRPIRIMPSREFWHEKRIAEEGAII